MEPAMMHTINPTPTDTCATPEADSDTKPATLTVSQIATANITTLIVAPTMKAHPSFAVAPTRKKPIPMTARIIVITPSPLKPLLLTAVSYTHLRAHETRHDIVC